MAIDKVRERHERWIKLALIILMGGWLAYSAWQSLDEQRPWVEISRSLFIPAIMMLSLCMDFLPTPTFILTWCILSLGLWLEANGFKAGIAFYKDFDHNGWLFLAAWLFYSYIAISVLFAWLTKASAKTAAG